MESKEGVKTRSPLCQIMVSPSLTELFPSDNHFQAMPAQRVHPSGELAEPRVEPPADPHPAGKSLGFSVLKSGFTVVGV